MEVFSMNEKNTVVSWRYVRIAGLLAVIAAVANGIGDIFYQGVADGAYDANMQFMWKVAESNLRIGAYVGLFVIPLAMAGYWHVYQGIRKAGPWLSLPPVLVAMYTVPIGCAFHFGLFYPALVGHQIIGNSGDVEQILKLLHTAMNDANGVLGLVYQAGVVVFSLWLMTLVFLGKTRYPRWFGFLNPLFLAIVYMLLVSQIPKYGTYLHPAAALSDAVFFAVSTKLLWKNET
jgi:hypothetical protein